VELAIRSKGEGVYGVGGIRKCGAVEGALNPSCTTASEHEQCPAGTEKRAQQQRAASRTLLLSHMGGSQMYSPLTALLSCLIAAPYIAVRKLSTQGASELALVLAQWSSSQAGRVKQYRVCDKKMKPRRTAHVSDSIPR
jgi:hypothetical protein